MLALKGKGSVSKGNNISATKWRKVANIVPPLVTANNLCKDKEKTSKPIIPIPIISQVKNSFGKMELAGGMLQLANKADCIEIYGLFGASKLIASHADRLDISSLPAGTYRYIRCARDSTK